MQTLVLIVTVTLLTGCSVMQDKMDAMNGSCAPPIHSMCEPNESLLICDSADKKDCHGWILE
tara:strand:+ start:87 stop:272 length:186 start_codon:yes stop_codon:yes gene_type:complete